MHELSASDRSPAWVWSICGILFLATFLNYANRVPATQNSVEIIETFRTNREGYGKSERAFGYGFASGGLLFGYLADKISIRVLYPLLMIAWSAAGAASGFATTLDEFSDCRFLLGLFEAGHWPCSLRMTQRTFLPAQRTLGNGILQSGASVGQILVPQLIKRLADLYPGQWQMSCWLIGAAGLPWVILWLAAVRESDVQRPVIQTDEQAAGAGRAIEIREEPLLSILLSRRWWLLLLTVVSINVPWHYIRVWMPDTLRVDHKYERAFVDNFTSLYYLATFGGSLSVGWIIQRLVGRGWNVQRARLATFGGLSLLVACSVPAAFLPKGNLFLAMLLLTAFGSLGVAPIYYSLNQELSGKNQGKVGGSLSFLLWCILALMQGQVGYWVERLPTIRPYLFATVGVLPLVACGALALFWGKRAE